jgi:hypothetical protein
MITLQNKILHHSATACQLGRTASRLSWEMGGVRDLPEKGILSAWLAGRKLTPKSLTSSVHNTLL